jgi:hypothetical protein
VPTQCRTYFVQTGTDLHTQVKALFGSPLRANGSHEQEEGIKLCLVDLCHDPI